MLIIMYQSVCVGPILWCMYGCVCGCVDVCVCVGVGMCGCVCVGVYMWVCVYVGGLCTLSVIAIFIHMGLCIYLIYELIAYVLNIQIQLAVNKQEYMFTVQLCIQ